MPHGRFTTMLESGILKFITYDGSPLELQLVLLAMHKHQGPFTIFEIYKKSINSNAVII